MTTQSDGLVLLDNEYLVAEGSVYHGFNPEISVFPDGSYIVTYSLGDILDTDVYAQRFSPDGTKVGDAFVVNSDVSGVQGFSDLITFQDGSFIVTWMSKSPNSSGGDNYDIYSQRYNSDGVPIGGSVHVNESQEIEWPLDTNNNVSLPAPESVVLSDGSYVTVWQSERANINTTEIYIRTFSAEGVPLSEPLKVNQEYLGNQLYPQVSPTENGFVLTWFSTDDDDIYSRQFDLSGQALGEEFVVNATTIDTQQFSDVVELTSGDLVYVWQSANQANSDTDNKSNFDIVTRTLSADGVWSSETIVGEYNLIQANPDVSALSDGGYVITWISDHDVAHTSEKIYAQRFNADGSLNGSELIINQSSVVDGAVSPEVEELPNGDLIFTWRGGDGVDSSWNVYTATVQAPGNQVQPEGFIASSDEVVLGGATDYQLESKVTALEDGGYVVSYQAQESGTSNWDVYLQRFASDGSPVGTEVLVNTSDYDERGVDIASLSNGGYVVSWMSMISSPNTSQIKMQIFDDQGLPVGTEISVSGTTYGPAQAATTVLENGNIVVTWRETQPDTSSMDILAKIYSADGSLLVDKFQVNTQVTGTQQSPSIDSLSDGGFIVSYDSGDGAGYGVFAQRFDANGNLVGDELQINDTTLNHQWTSSVTALENGGLVVAWTDRVLTDISSENVVFKVYDSAGQSVGEIEIADPGIRESQVNVIALSDGGFVLAYQITNSPDSEIFMQRYNSDGSVSGDLQQISTNNRAFSPDVAELANGDVVVSWHAIDSLTGSYLVHSRTFEVPGNTQVDPVPANNAPELNNVVTDVQLDESDSIDISLPVGLFSDPDGDVLTISATLADGSDLPAWLVFDAASQSFSGSAVDAGSYEIEVSAFDGELTTSTRFTIDIEAAPAPVNTAPIVDQLILDQEAHLEENFQFSVPNDAFNDLDGDALSYSAQLANGEPLPSWLSFDGQNFSGTPTRFSDPLDIEVIASDGSAQVSQVFTLVLNTPVWGVGDYHRGDLKVGSDAAINLGEYAFVDENGADTLSFSFADAAGNNVDWLSIEQVQNGWAVKGNHTNAEVGTHEVFLTATDGHFDRTMQMDITVLAGNGAPIAGASDLEVIFQKSQLFKMAPQGLFSDPEGDTLTYNATNLPDWLYFNPSNGFMMSRSTELYDSVVLNIEASDGENVAVNTLKVEEHNTDWTEQAMTFGDGSTGRNLVQDVDGDTILQADEALVVNDTLVNVDDLTILRLYQATSTDATSTQFEAATASSDVFSVAQGLIESSGFVALADADENGSVSNDELIAHLYNANYGRSATTAEESYWQSRFNTDGATKGEVVAEFSSSDEYADASTEAVANLIHQNEDWWA